ncbi:MAG TPA: sulfotransferase [Steroidobacteraceae bacterium]|nr:sulfotransferase [Steroidobacteraceae bacterium]
MAAAAPNSAPSRIEAGVLRVRGFMEKNRFEEALRAAQSLLEEVPENRDVLYMMAVSQRYLGHIGDALATLSRFEKLHPQYSRLFQEQGHCHVALRDAPAAIQAYLRAVNLNPALPASWRALNLLFRSTGQIAESQMAAAHAAKLATLPAAVVDATSMFADGEVTAAENVIRLFLQSNPSHVEGMRLLAQIGMKLDVLDDAEFLLESVLVFEPEYHLARHEYVQVLLQRHRPAKALEESNKLLKVDPLNRGYRTVYATACAALGDYDEALRVYRQLSCETPEVADLHLSIAHTLKTRGARQEAIDAYKLAAAVNPSYGDAYWSLANLKTYRFTEDEIARMRAAEAAPAIPLVDRYHLCFALGKALEDRAEYADSYGYYERGNALKKDESRYRPEPIERNAQLQASVCTSQFFAARANVGCDRDDPIFIVGLPRSGSTLLEQILASHSQVEGTMELAEIPRLVHMLQGRDYRHDDPRYPGALAGLTADQLRQFGEKYLSDTEAYRTGKRFFIDKMPNNFRHLGLIHLILPNAKIIDARREPMACCFSNFKQLFASGQEFTYGIEDIARYYRSYVELMAHWDTALPGKILRVQHEDVVTDLEGNVRRLLDFCGLGFEAGCLEFYKTERSVRTASSEQVRQPIFTEGLDQWRHFEPWLGPLKTALGPLAQTA